MRHLLITGLLVAALAAGAGMAQDHAAPASAEDIKPSSAIDPQQFAASARLGNLLEVETSALAKGRTRDPDVAAFARMMIQDHSRADAELEAAAMSEGTALPAALDPDGIDKLQQLTDATGADRDQLYAKLQTQAHVEAIALFSGYAGSGPAGPLRDFATTTLPKLKVHYATVQQLHPHPGQ